MRKGRHESKHKPNGKRAGKHALLLLSLIVVLCVATVGTVAYFTDTAQSESTGITIGQVSCTVTDNGNGSFTVTNTGNVPAYIRVAVVANYVATENNSSTVHYTAPKISYVKFDDTEMSSPNNDGIYYYPTAVPAEGQDSFTVTVATSGALEGYDVDVELVAEAIQGGVPAVAQDAWGYTPKA